MEFRYKFEKILFLFPLVAKHHMSLQLRWRHLTYRHMGCRTTSQRASEFFAAHVRIKGLHVFLALNAENCFFAIYIVRLSLHVCLKKSAIVLEVITI